MLSWGVGWSSTLDRVVNKIVIDGVVMLFSAQAQGLLCEEAGNYSDSVKYCGYCSSHYKKVVSYQRPLLTFAYLQFSSLIFPYLHLLLLNFVYLYLVYLCCILMALRLLWCNVMTESCSLCLSVSSCFYPLMFLSFCVPPVHSLHVIPSFCLINALPRCLSLFVSPQLPVIYSPSN